MQSEKVRNRLKTNKFVIAKRPDGRIQVSWPQPRRTRPIAQTAFGQGSSLIIGAFNILCLSLRASDLAVQVPQWAGMLPFYLSAYVLALWKARRAVEKVL